MSDDLTGKVAAVTGAARGIGRACAVRLAQAGADVAIIDIDLDSGARYAHEPAGTTQEQVGSLGRRAFGVQADLTDERQAHDAVAAIVDPSTPVRRHNGRFPSPICHQPGHRP